MDKNTISILTEFRKKTRINKKWINSLFLYLIIEYGLVILLSVHSSKSLKALLKIIYVVKLNTK